MSETPETDAQQLVHSVSGATLHCIDVEFARKMERERDDARKELDDEIERGRVLRGMLESGDRDEALAAAKWAVQWLDTVIDRLQHEATIKELFEDMAVARETNSVLGNEWNRCGWTREQADHFVKNWRKEETQ